MNPHRPEISAETDNHKQMAALLASDTVATADTVAAATATPAAGTGRVRTVRPARSRTPANLLANVHGSLAIDIANRSNARGREPSGHQVSGAASGSSASSGSGPSRSSRSPETLEIFAVLEALVVNTEMPEPVFEPGCTAFACMRKLLHLSISGSCYN